MNRQKLINKVLKLGKKLKVSKELTNNQLNNLEENNLIFIIELINDRLEKRSVAWTT